jgi:sigma-B regulation protein RsbU (phosphoserine phosphatase)
MMKNRGLALKLALLILTSITLIFSVVFIYNYFFSRQIITDNIEKNANSVASATVNRIDSVLRALEKVPQSLAYFLESSAYDSDDIMELIRSVIEHNPEIYGATIAFEPYAYDSKTLRIAPYFFKSEGSVEFTYIRYEYFYSDWYQIPKELDRPIWTEPYYDVGAGEIVMATYSVPFYKTVSGKRKFMGIVTADISLSWLQEMVASIKIAKTGYGFLITKNGTFVTHPASDFIMNETIFSVAEAKGDAHLRELGREMIRGKSGFVPFRSMVTGENCWMVYAPLSASGWSLGVLFPQDELMADISRLNRTVLFISLAGFLVILAVIVWIAGSITKPLRLLSRATEQIGSGDLDVEIPPVKSRDEVGKLADSFNYMKSSLKKYIKELTETTAAKERIESELKIAHDIQMGMLPKVFPPFPDRAEFDIYAMLDPAREVGGDLYDFFFMDEDHLCFTVGDVSDKGVPAALYMTIVMTLIRTKASQGVTTDTVLGLVNQDISVDNPSAMFVTLFLGILNIRTGELQYSNGGHNPPYLIRARGDLEPLETTQGMALGIDEDFSYQSKTIVLQKGESIFLYTDGVTEAMNAKEELFTEQRMEKELAVLKESPVKGVINGMLEKIEAFSEGVEQHDDITMLILRFYGG